MTLKRNQRVRITGDAGVAIGRVEDVRPVAEMPDPAAVGLPYLPSAGEFAPRNILIEMGVERVASISYHASPTAELLFTALEIGGEWYDLRRQKLELEVVGVAT